MLYNKIQEDKLINKKSNICKTNKNAYSYQ